MQKSTLELTDDAAALLDLGVALGQNQTFSLVAGRCSAAQAATLLRLRQEKKYLKCAANWREFCTNYLKISGSEADRMIRLWEEFGASFKVQMNAGDIFVVQTPGGGGFGAAGTADSA